MYHNPLFAIDFYKVDHRRQYPEGTTQIYSNLTPRYVKHCHSLLPDYDNQVVVFGIQAFIQEVLIEQWQYGFFDRPRFQVLREYQDMMYSALGLECFDCSHIAALHDLGYLPIKIKAINEGFRVPIGVPVLTIVNTHPDFFWLTNYLETVLSASLWKSMTTATIAFEMKRLLTRYTRKTGADESFIPYQAHDFSFRGMSGLQDAAMSGAGHLTSFIGTDCVPAIEIMNEFYDGRNTVPLVGSSVPATEHSVMTCSGVDGEFDTIRRLITEVYPDGIVSIVADSFNLWQVLTVYLPSLYKEIHDRQGKVVIRPDCYSEDTSIFTPNGWRLFKDLSDDDLVAQVNEDGTYNFVSPLKLVSYEYEGIMHHFHDHHGKIDLLVTPNHRMIYKKFGKWIVEYASESTAYFEKNIVRSARAVSKGENLTWLHRLLIAFQADGSFPSKIPLNQGMITGLQCIRFNFSKQRKIDRLIAICEQGLFKYKVSSENARPGQKTIYVWVDKNIFISKTLDWFDCSDLCGDWCSQFIEEMSHWDSSIRNLGRIKFDTCNKETIEAVEIIALSAGYGCLISVREDNRKPEYNDVYTAHITINNEAGGQSIQHSEKPYNGKVYCVQVPSGKLLVKRNRSVAVCGNSGDPASIICGDLLEIPGSPAHKGALQCLWETFGGRINSSGYKELHSKVGLIYGDAITVERAQLILSLMEEKGFASTNIIFGMGSYTYQYVTRDTFGFAVKATSAVINGERKAIFKDPITADGSKKSAKGLLMVDLDNETGRFYLTDNVSESTECDGYLQTVYCDGKLIKETNLSDIRKNLVVELENFSE